MLKSVFYFAQEDKLFKYEMKKNQNFEQKKKGNTN